MSAVTATVNEIERRVLAGEPVDPSELVAAQAEVNAADRIDQLKEQRKQNERVLEFQTARARRAKDLCDHLAKCVARNRSIEEIKRQIVEAGRLLFAAKCDLATLRNEGIKKAREIEPQVKASIGIPVVVKSIADIEFEKLLLDVGITSEELMIMHTEPESEYVRFGLAFAELENLHHLESMPIRPAAA